MKIMILIFSAALHVLLLSRIPGYRAPGRIKPSGHSVSFVGVLPDRIPSPYAERAERPAKPYSHYRSPEGEKVIVEPEAFNYYVRPEAPLPAIDSVKASEALVLPDIPQEFNLLGDSLSRYEIEPVPFEERILP